MKTISPYEITKMNIIYMQSLQMNKSLSEEQLIELLHSYASILKYPLSRSQSLSIAGAQSTLKLINPAQYAYKISKDLAYLDKITEDDLRQIIVKYR